MASKPNKPTAWAAMPTPLNMLGQSMKHIFQSALDVIAKWDDDKFNHFLPYMRETMDQRDIDYITNKRRIMAEHGHTFPRQAAFTLIKR
jgi:hypothetical protein